MAKIADILAIESIRETVNDQKLIHLFTEGTFLRAYEWSAWLFIGICYQRTEYQSRGVPACTFRGMFIGIL